MHAPSFPASAISELVERGDLTCMRTGAVLPCIVNGRKLGEGRGSGSGPGNGPGLGPGRNRGVGGDAYHTGNGVMSPRLIGEIKPGSTAEAMRARIQGIGHAPGSCAAGRIGGYRAGGPIARFGFRTGRRGAEDRQAVALHAVYIPQLFTATSGPGVCSTCTSNSA
jgi:hypothetical protein